MKLAVPKVLKNLPSKPLLVIGAFFRILVFRTTCFRTLLICFSKINIKHVGFTAARKFV